jgi:hypothetical protein
MTRLTCSLTLALYLWVDLPVAAKDVFKEGVEHSVPLLQTHVRPLLGADHLYWGILEGNFSRYADQNQWQSLNPRRLQNQVSSSFYALGGGGLYTPEGFLVFAQEANVRTYFRRNRLVGLLILPTTQNLDLLTLTQWSRAWFPDDEVILQYQVETTESGQRILQALLGEVPPEFAGDVQKLLAQPRRLRLAQG